MYWWDMLHVILEAFVMYAFSFVILTFLLHYDTSINCKGTKKDMQIMTNQLVISWILRLELEFLSALLGS